MTEEEFRVLCESFLGLDLSAIIGRARELRKQSDKAEQDFLLYLVALDRSDRWRETQTCPTFERFLDKHDICKPSRYANWRRAVEELPFDSLAVIGVNGAVAAVAVESQERRAVVIGRMIERAQKNGVPLSRQTASALAERGVDRPTVEEREATAVQRLEQELSAARSKIRELEHEVRALRSELERERSGAKTNRAQNNSTLAKTKGDRNGNRSRSVA